MIGLSGRHLSGSWRHTRLVLLPLLLVLALLAGGIARPAMAASDSTRVLPQLQDDAAKNPSKVYRLLVTRINKDTKSDEKLKALGGTKIKDLTNGNGFVANLSGSKIADLGKDPYVKFVEPDAEMVHTGVVDPSKLAPLYPQVIKASGLWSSTAPLTGAGVGVAVLDTGVNPALPDWKGANGASRLIASPVFNSLAKGGNDGHGHGTHVAGIIGGNSWYNTTTAGVQGKYIGIAPEAKIISVKVSDETGMSYTSDVVNAIDWVIQNRQLHNIRVMNMSMVSSVPESAKTSTLAAAVERAWFNGILVVTAAGNTGANTVLYPPANDPFVVTVGAADPMTTVAMGDDTLAPWSSYGMTQDGVSKPEVVAPGRYIVAPLSSGGATLAKQFPDRIVDSTYLRMSGTSMAAPVVSGLAALAFQAHPEWSNDQVKWLLMNTGTQLGSTTTTTTTDPITGSSVTTQQFVAQQGQGAGEVNALAVTSYQGVPPKANQGLPVNEQLLGPNGATSYTADSTASWNSSSWATSSWATSSWATSSWATSSWATSNFSTSSWASSSWASSNYSE